MCLHTTVLLDGTAVEVYILSLEMDWVAEFGVGAYWRHNEELQNTDTGRSLLSALHSTWILQANQSLTHSLQTLEVMDPDPLPRRTNTSTAVQKFNMSKTSKTSNVKTAKSASIAGAPGTASAPMAPITSATSISTPPELDLLSFSTKEVEQLEKVEKVPQTPGSLTDASALSTSDFANEEILADLEKELDSIEPSQGPTPPTPAPPTPPTPPTPVPSELEQSERSNGNGRMDGGLFAVQPLLQRISKVAFSFADSGGDTDDEGRGELLEELHRAYNEALREKVAVFTPTGRVLYLPRDATPLDFAVWNLDAEKGLRAEAAFIDGIEAPLNATLREASRSS